MFFKKGMRVYFSQAALFICILAMLSLSGCDFQFLFTTRDTARILFRLESDVTQKTLQPGISLSVASYDISGSGPNSSSFSITGITSESYLVSNLLAGEWTIVVLGKNSNGTAIVKKEENIVLSENVTTDLDVVCVPLAGMGSFSLDVSWPDNLINAAVVQANLIPDIGDSIPLAFDIDGNSAVFQGNIPNGYYNLSFKLKDEQTGDHLIWSWNEAVLIYSDQETGTVWTLEESELDIRDTGNLNLTLKSDNKSPITIVLSGQRNTLLEGTGMTISAQGDPQPDSWRWFLDGDMVAGETNSSITLGDALIVNSVHSLVAIGKKGDTLGSAGFRFRVTSEPSDFSLNLASEYLLQENAEDTGPAGLSGTPSNVVFDNGAIFNGLDSVITIPEPNLLLQQTEDWSFMCVFSTVASGWQAIYAEEDGVGGGWHALQIDAVMSDTENYVSLGIFNYGWYDCYSPVDSLTPGQHVLGISKKGTSITINIDGTNYTTTIGTSLSNFYGGKAWIGACRNWQANPFNGKIGNIRIWEDRALTEDEMIEYSEYYQSAYL